MDNILQVELDSLSFMGLALHQNGVQVVRSLVLRNGGAEAMRDLRVTMKSDPEFFTPVTTVVAEVPAEGAIAIKDIEIVPNHSFLSSTNERVRGSIVVEVFAQGGDAPIARFAKPVDICAHDEWFGGDTMPDMLAAFVTPNSDAVVALLGRVAEMMKERSGDSALDGYQRGDKTRVLLMVKCIYDAVLEAGVNYAEPPPSFGEKGQRVRFPDSIVATKFATCLDFTLLFAGMMEQCGLNPIVMLCRKHAYVSCHLVSYHFPDSVVDDLQSLRKRAEIDEIVAIETTCAAGGRAKFSSAMAEGAKHLDNNAEFYYALDIRQARSIGIRPLSGVAGLKAMEASGNGAAVDSDEDLPTLSEAVEHGDVEKENVPPRVARWRSKLLDLSRRNRLLNFKDSKQAIQLAFFDMPKLEDALNGGTEFYVHPVSDVFRSQAGDPRDLSQLERTRGENPVVKFVNDEFERRRLRTYLDEKELLKRLTELYRTCRVDIEEGGVNTLFVAAGFLKWTDGSGASAQSYMAPLILLPVRIERENARSGYTLVRTDDEPTVNVTLLEMLKRDFGKMVNGLNPPPGDDSGIDVNAVMRIFRDVVVDVKGWEVVDDIWVGRLFFNKFIMWDDMNRRLDDLCKSPVVGHIINGGGSAFDDGIVPVMPNEVDSSLDPVELFCPMSADSSQLAAVISASRGKNFVLHGPPGTGKSQTITNLIAYCLAEGKTVLFVAEKRAALEVVQRRLKRLGLDPFCLELHSNKAGKSEVLRQFGEAMAYGDMHEPSAWAAVAADLEASRNALSGYVAELHRSYPCGLTPYRAFSYLMVHAAEEESIRAVGPLQGAKLSAGELEAMQESGRELAAQAGEIKPSLFDEFAFARPVAWAPAWEQAAVNSANALATEALRISDLLTAFGNLAGIPDPISAKRRSFDEFTRLALLLKTLPRMPEGFFAADWDEFSSVVSDASAAGSRCNELQGDLAGFDMDAVASFDVNAMRRRLEENAKRFALIRSMRNGKARKDVAAALKPGVKRKIAKRDLAALMDKFEEYAAKRKVVENLPDAVKSRMGAMFSGLDSDWKSVDTILSVGKSLFESATKIADGKQDALRSICSALGAQACAPQRSYQVAEMTEFATAHAKFSDALAAFKTVMHADEAYLAERGVVLSAVSMAHATLEETRHLRRWCIWNEARSRALSAGIAPVVAAVEGGELDIGKTQFAIAKRYSERFVADVIDNVDALRNFLGNSQDGLVEKFAHIDAEVEKLAQQMIVAKLSARLPSGRLGTCPAASELGILKRECEKKSRHKPVRTLLESIPTILPVLKPCMLMSPISVAQYLPPGSNNFDIIVFDEASQITVWDAIGAMARGKQVVIVGDPKQLPPTTFFQRQAENESVDDSDIEELESILDECKAAGVSDLHLLWHYRSRHESLIAFSNHNYYNDALMTFPSPVRDSKTLGVSFRLVERGVYDKSKTRTNRMEAEALVEAVVARLRDPQCAGKSTGVVTFSEAQQSLIEDLIDEKRTEFPEIEKFFSEDNVEPFFVKNLENVQGDERDAIYFSICYGFDSQGKFAMNFGPLNRPGGERRLNVAVTRAKEQVVVFSSVKSIDIDTGRTQAMGAVHLKSFLEYAERGNSQLVYTKVYGADQDAALFENEVAAFLSVNGYKVDRQVGCSGYRIDVAVRAAGDDGRYVIGIECDGEQYSACDSARDRDKLRRIVLEGLGWRLTRVWCASWWFDREAAQRKLLAEVDAAVRGLPPPVAGKQEFKSYSTAAAETQGGFSPSFSAAPVPNDREKTYVPTDFVGDYAKSQSNFNLDFGPQIIGEQMRRIVKDEGPILESLLFSRVIKEWGFSRVGSSMAVVLEKSVGKSFKTTKQFGERVFWPEGVDPASYRLYRIPGDADEAVRQVKELPLVEIKNAMESLRDRFHALTDEALYVETAKVFGIARVTATVRKYFDEAIKLMK